MSIFSAGKIDSRPPNGKRVTMISACMGIYFTVLPPYGHSLHCPSSVQAFTSLSFLLFCKHKIFHKMEAENKMAQPLILRSIQ